MDVSALSHAVSSPSSPPPQRNKIKPSIFARLRRQPIPYQNPSGAASTPAIPLHRANTAVGFGGTGSVRGVQVSAPIMLGMNRSEEIFGTAMGTSNGMGLEDEVEWERVRTLPRVRLVPPEDEGEPIILYPPPHFLRPATPPPKLPHPFLSPPSSPPTSPPQPYTRSSTSPPNSPPRRPASIYSTNATWAGMADGFILPPPKFSRGGNGGVVMPKTRQELVQDREKRMSGVWNDVMAAGIRSPPITHMLLDQSEDMILPPPANDVRMPPSAPPVQVDHVSAAAPVHDSNPAAGESSRSLSTAVLPDRPFEADLPPIEVGSTSAVTAEQTPKPAVSRSVRKSRALSLSAALSSSLRASAETKDDTSAATAPPMPTVPNVIRKQKSLKKFFSSTPTGMVMSAETIDSTSVPPVPARRSSMEDKPREAKGRGILSRARSKPTLRIDVKASKNSSGSESAPVTPGLSTGRSEAASSVISQTPNSAPARVLATVPAFNTTAPKLSKRFSLSNMSQAFKKKSAGTPSSSSSSASPVPKVPDLPEAYKKEKDLRGRILESAVPLSPRSTATAKLHQGEDSEIRRSQDSPQRVIVDEPVLTPTGLPRRSESLKALERLALDNDARDHEQASSSDVPEAPSALGLTLGPASPPILQPLGPAFDLGSVADEPATRPTSVVSATTTSTGGSTTLDTIDLPDVDENEEELVHAQLMQISPRTRRDPSQSLQQFIANAPAKQGNVVIVPRGVRRSVEAVLVGQVPGLFTSAPGVIGERGLDKVTEERESDPDLKAKEVQLSTAELERRGSADSVNSDESISTPLDEQEAFFRPTGQAEPTQALFSDRPTALSHMQRGDEDELDSLPSDTVLVEVETPPAPPPSTTSTSHSTPTSKNRFASPEGILRKLQLPSSRKQQTPYYTSVSVLSAQDRGAKYQAPTPFAIPIPPIPQKSAERGKDGKKGQQSALLAAVQLRSLHFDSLDLDFDAWSGAESGVGVEEIEA